MTDTRDRIFVEICYDSSSDDPEELCSKALAAVAGLGERQTATKDRPPRIFSDDELKARFVNLLMTAQKFSSGYKKMFGVDLILDPRLLYLATISTFDDIERYKAYHLERPYRDRSDSVKRSAYLVKWISRIQPFQTSFVADPKTGTSDDMSDIKPALCNILFAITVANTHLSNDAKAKVVLEPRAVHHLSYDLLYRGTNESGLLAFYQTVVDLVAGNKLIKS